MGFALTQGVDLVGRQPRRVAKLGVDSGAGSAEAKGEITLAIHGGTAHPAPGRVRLVGAFLKNSDRSGSDVAQFEPAHSGHTTRAYGVVAHDRFVVAKIPVGEAEHQTVADAIEITGRSYSLLRHACAGSRTERRVGRGGRSSKGSKGRARGRSKVYVEMIGGVILIGDLAGESHE
ncbi:MAG: hypothetical protein DLM73_06445 [Chthoniobacterales bacterium]|nr:MAG: hypothetical protein DLM73_06445 [Chthoniobacterales bacterium]